MSEGSSLILKIPKFRLRNLPLPLRHYGSISLGSQTKNLFMGAPAAPAGLGGSENMFIGSTDPDLGGGRTHNFFDWSNHSPDIPR